MFSGYVPGMLAAVVRHGCFHDAEIGDCAYLEAGQQ